MGPLIGGPVNLSSLLQYLLRVILQLIITQVMEREEKRCTVPSYVSVFRMQQLSQLLRTWLTAHTGGKAVRAYAYRSTCLTPQSCFPWKGNNVWVEGLLFISFLVWEQNTAKLQLDWTLLAGIWLCLMAFKYNERRTREGQSWNSIWKLWI